MVSVVGHPCTLFFLSLLCFASYVIFNHHSYFPAQLVWKVFHLPPAAFWTSRGRRLSSRLPPRHLPSFFSSIEFSMPTARPLLVDVHRVLLTHTLAHSATGNKQWRYRAIRLPQGLTRILLGDAGQMNHGTEPSLLPPDPPSSALIPNNKQTRLQSVRTCF